MPICRRGLNPWKAVAGVARKAFAAWHWIVRLHSQQLVLPSVPQCRTTTPPQCQAESWSPIDRVTLTPPGRGVGNLSPGSPGKTGSLVQPISLRVCQFEAARLQSGRIATMCTGPGRRRDCLEGLRVRLHRRTGLVSRDASVTDKCCVPKYIT